MAARKFIDIGANLTDSMFSGIYNGSQKHTGDLKEVLLRAYNAGLQKIIDPKAYYEQLKNCLEDNPDKAVAVGECGLDYDRQLQLAHTSGLPLFLHCRNAHADLLDILRRHIAEFGPVTGVVHTFDGTADQANDLLNLGLYLGFNGCSLKLPENLKVSYCYLSVCTCDVSLFIQ
ncbi:unnamed protein product [Dibothriocephalus latus]|uniref:Deoxyribonuclease TATDN1 n=1 Tax=Dibothriocephalus latus TaxID=60516 RepID=A0A3P7N296_DIBLA|nr:unnamed protein product [Dibothriocephalus latus]